MMNNMATKEMHLVRWPLLNPDSGILPATTLCWAEIEKVEGATDFSGLADAISAARNIGRSVALRINAEPPAWATAPATACAAFITALGKQYDAEPALFSIDIVLPCPEDELDDTALARLADTYTAAFPSTWKLLDIRNRRLAGFLKDRNGVGLLLDARQGTERIGEQIAELGLGKLWRKAPVRMITKQLDEGLMREAVRWHVSSIDTAGGDDVPSLAGIGHRIEPRRISFSTAVTPGQAATLRVWIVNTGNAPAYTITHFNLRLCRPGCDDGQVSRIDFAAKTCLPGEDTVLEVPIQVGTLPGGEYDVHLGLFSDETGYPIVTGTDGRISDGYYTSFLRVNIK